MKDLDQAGSCEIFGLLCHSGVSFLSDVPEHEDIQVLSEIDVLVDVFKLDILLSLEEVPLAS